jgi:hypothetical protein
MDRGPGELFAEYCDREGIVDDRVGALFARLLDETTEGGG